MGSFILDSLPTLTEVDIMYGSFTSAKWLIPLIADASLSCGLKEDVTGDQLQFTAMAIFSRYRWLKASEVMLFFFNFKAGFYERFYSYFDTQTIIRSVKTFIEERTLAIVAHERNLQFLVGLLTFFLRPFRHFFDKLRLLCSFFAIFATAIRKESKTYLLCSLSFTTTRKSKCTLRSCPIWAQISRICAWFVVNREAYGEGLRLFVCCS